MKDELLKQEGYDVMAAAFEVHNELGVGLLEEIYQESFEIELTKREIPFRAQSALTTFYKGKELKKKYVPDLVIFGSIIVELKAVSALADENRAQLINYLRISKSKVGYLINFAPMTRVEWQRVIL